MPNANTLLIKSGTVVTASEIKEADVFIEGEKIRAIGKDLDTSAERVIDAKDCYLFPGGVDPHTHLDMQVGTIRSSDTFETGTLAALHGGTTTIIDFAMQARGNTLRAGLEEWHEKARGKALGDYAFHLGVTDYNERTSREVKDIIEKECVPSFKAFMAYKGRLMIDDRQLAWLMTDLKKWGGLLSVHAEDGDLADALAAKNRAAGNLAPRFHALSRPPECEAEATGRIADLAYAGGHPLYVVHMTCDEALEKVRQAALRKQRIYAETCIQYLLLDDSCYEEENFGGAKYVISPPIRKKKDQEALWKAIAQGLIDVVATDHCPFTLEEKRMGLNDFSKIPNGAPGIENRMELLFSEGVKKDRITLNRFVEVTATAPARIFGLYPKKGIIAVGSDADVVIFDPRVKHTISAKTHHMKCDYNTYEGWKVEGRCRQTILRGELAIDEGKALIGKGFGKFFKRAKLG